VLIRSLKACGPVMGTMLSFFTSPPCGLAQVDDSSMPRIEFAHCDETSRERVLRGYKEGGTADPTDTRPPRNPHIRIACKEEVVAVSVRDSEGVTLAQRTLVNPAEPSQLYALGLIAHELWTAVMLGKNRAESAQAQAAVPGPKSVAQVEVPRWRKFLNVAGLVRLPHNRMAASLGGQLEFLWGSERFEVGPGLSFAQGSNSVDSGVVEHSIFAPGFGMGGTVVRTTLGGLCFKARANAGVSVIRVAFDGRARQIGITGKQFSRWTSEAHLGGRLFVSAATAYGFYLDYRLAYILFPVAARVAGQPPIAARGVVHVLSIGVGLSL